MLSQNIIQILSLQLHDVEDRMFYTFLTTWIVLSICSQYHMI